MGRPSDGNAPLCSVALPTRRYGIPKHYLPVGEYRPIFQPTHEWFHVYVGKMVAVTSDVLFRYSRRAMAKYHDLSMMLRSSAIAKQDRLCPTDVSAVHSRRLG
ncbi:hypothetical protein B296_00032125 [Ensete ventricosum]|uniref:Uncharacterized protein n=1 Tax=Ensete ventricosum TaxID=4639 RepID=A0A426ZIN4_ENSVE|nr:hypothetical protein B296_00032125 [Ensete ventricosum]